MPSTLPAGMAKRDGGKVPHSTNAPTLEEMAAAVGQPLLVGDGGQIILYHSYQELLDYVGFPGGLNTGVQVFLSKTEGGQRSVVGKVYSDMNEMERGGSSIRTMVSRLEAALRAVGMVPAEIKPQDLEFYELVKRVENNIWYAARVDGLPIAWFGFSHAAEAVRTETPKRNVREPQLLQQDAMKIARVIAPVAGVFLPHFVTIGESGEDRWG
jgi:hypothetical protein